MKIFSTVLLSLSLSACAHWDFRSEQTRIKEGRNSIDRVAKQDIAVMTERSTRLCKELYKENYKSCLGAVPDDQFIEVRVTGGQLETDKQ